MSPLVAVRLFPFPDWKGRGRAIAGIQRKNQVEPLPGGGYQLCGGNAAITHRKETTELRMCALTIEASSWPGASWGRICPPKMPHTVFMPAAFSAVTACNKGESDKSSSFPRPLVRGYGNKRLLSRILSESALPWHAFWVRVGLGPRFILDCYWTDSRNCEWRSKQFKQIHWVV